jgi:hypothetical protein
MNEDSKEVKLVDIPTGRVVKGSDDRTPHAIYPDMSQVSNPAETQVSGPAVSEPTSTAPEAPTSSDQNQ